MREYVSISEPTLEVSTNGPKLRPGSVFFGGVGKHEWGRFQENINHGCITQKNLLTAINSTALQGEVCVGGRREAKDVSRTYCPYPSFFFKFGDRRGGGFLENPEIDPKVGPPRPPPGPLPGPEKKNLCYPQTRFKVPIFFSIYLS